MIYKIDNSLELCQLKLANDEKGEFTGYATTYGGNDLANDTIKNGAFNESIAKGLPKMFLNHRHMEIPVGDYVEAKEDDFGLLLRGVIDLNHRDGPSLYSAMLRKAISALSIGALKSTLVFERKSEGGKLITKGDLKEVSAVTFPMDERAEILTVKSEIKSIENFKDVEYFLRELGVLPRSMVTAFVSQFKNITQSESDNVMKEQNTELKAKIMEYEKRLNIKGKTSHLVDFINKL